MTTPGSGGSLRFFLPRCGALQYSFAMRIVRIAFLLIAFLGPVLSQPISVTVLNQKNSSRGVNGRLAPQHIRIQPVSQGVPQKAPDQWDFSQLDAVLMPVLGVADHSPEIQIATAPSFMNDSQGHLTRAHFQDFAKYSANLVRYYNKGGFDASGKHYQSLSPYHVTWWGIFNEPNINGLSADDYVNLYNLVVPAMLAVDPEIKIVAMELADFGDEPQKMLPAFVQKVKAHVDVVATHYYGSC